MQSSTRRLQKQNGKVSMTRRGILYKEEQKKMEEEILAEYAAKSFESRGKDREDLPCEFRNLFQRDRDSILYCSNFRNLEFKTQVYIFRESDYFRSRLTHTLEVMQTACSIARALRLHEDLVEAISLGHDLGHPAFGHAGEDALNECMKNYGGFYHNEHGVRVVEKLEKCGKVDIGLSLTWETKEGILKHTTVHNKSNFQRFYVNCNPNGTLEAQLVGLSDEIVQVSHDLDDALRAGLFGMDTVEWLVDKHNLASYYGKLKNKNYMSALFLDILMIDVANTTYENIKDLTFEDVMNSKKRFVELCSYKGLLDDLNKIKSDIINSPKVKTMDYTGKRVIKSLFEALKDEPSMLPREIQSRIDQDGVEICICDYLAGQTDRSALALNQRIFLPSHA